jgi:hypothetical protein
LNASRLDIFGAARFSFTARTFGKSFQLSFPTRATHRLFSIAKHLCFAVLCESAAVVYSFFRLGHSKSRICFGPHRFAAPQVYLE